MKMRRSLEINSVMALGLEPSNCDGVADSGGLGTGVRAEVLVAVQGGDLVSLFKIFQISVPVPVTMWRVPFVKSSRHTQGSRYRIASLLMRLNYLATAEGSRTNRLCNCAKFPTQQLKHSCGERSSEVTIG